MSADVEFDSFKETVADLDEYDLMDEHLIESVLPVPDRARGKYLMVLTKRAKDLGIARVFQNHLKTFDVNKTTSRPEQTYKGYNTGRYRVDENGISMITDDGLTMLTPTPMLITKEYINQDAVERWLDIEIYDKTYTVPARMVAEQNRVCELRDYGAIVYSHMAKDVSKYFAELETFNDIPKIDAYNTIGWHGDKFIPYDKESLFIDKQNELYVALSSTRGDKEQSKSVLERCARDTNFGRLMIASSVIAPALEVIDGMQSFVLFFWGGTGCGKSAAQKVACSIYGNPVKLFKTFNTTLNNLNSWMADYKSIPLILDEAQQFKDMKWGDMIYQLCSGQSKGRLSRNSISIESKHWSNVMIGTGEQPIISENTNAGALNRIYHLECTERWKDAREVVNLCEKHYGHYGEAITDYIIEHSVDIETEFRALVVEYEQTCDVSQKTANMMAQIKTGDLIFQRVTGIELPELSTSVLLDGVSRADDLSNSERAWNLVMNAIAGNNSKFAELHPYESWGKLIDNKCYILKNKLCEILTKQNHNFDNVKREWSDRGHIERNAQGKFTHTRTFFNNASGTYVCLVLSDEQRDTMETWMAKKR